MPDEHTASSHIVQEQSESVAATNLKVGGDLASHYFGLQYAQALDAAAGWRTLNQAAVGKMVEQIIMTSPTQGGTDVAGLQQLMKGAMATPPSTAQAPVVPTTPPAA